MHVRRASVWAESVLHVLAHVESREAASCHNPAWVTWIAERSGSAEARALGDDVRVLARTLRGDALARVQALAWVFDDTLAVHAATERELAALAPSEVASADALAIARSVGPVAEVLRAAAELELPCLDALEPIAQPALDAIGRELDALVGVAPSLCRLDVSVARPLGARGRLLGSSIVVGLVGCPDAEHAAWQAAHEATVHEVSIEERSGFLEVEREAIVRLRARARAGGHADAHARWLARLDLRGLGALEDR